MPILRLIAEGVGPFEKLDMDFSDGNGKPHLGPHILAGVNGSGKSTVLKTIAWVLDQGQRGFQYDDWEQVLTGYKFSRALLAMAPRASAPQLCAVTKAQGSEELRGWLLKAGASQEPRIIPVSGTNSSFAPNYGWQEPAAAYSPSRALPGQPRPDEAAQAPLSEQPGVRIYGSKRLSTVLALGLVQQKSHRSRAK